MTSSFGAGYSDVYLIRTGNVGIEESAKGKNIRFLQNYSNPFTGIAEIRYGLPKDMGVNISIYNSLGQNITTIEDSKRSAGSHTARWDAKDMSAGIYFIRLQVGDHTEIGKIVLMR